MREGELLKRIFERSAPLSAMFPHVDVGPGDDCAVVRTPGSKAGVLLKVDQVIEGRHFTPQTPIDLIARKAIARAVSDIAAMAGTPAATLVGAVLPRGCPQERADALYDALLRWSLHFGCPLVGGDTAVAGQDSPLSLSVTIMGTPHPTRGPVLRSNARPGDLLYITGAIGGSFRERPDAEFPFPGGGKHLTFEPRLREAAWLAEHIGQGLHAMMDVSDGLGIDTARLAERSAAAAEIDAEAVPLSAGQADAVRAAAHGEDYELLFAAAPDAQVPPHIAGTPITRIGRIVEWNARARARCEVLAHGRRTPADALGWEHAG